MKYVKGDLVKMLDNGEFDAIIHGCNCFCKMKSGIARQITDRWPSVAEADLLTIKGDKSKLGTSQMCYVKTKTTAGIVINAYTQYYYGHDGKQYVDYNAIEDVFSKLNSYRSFRLLTFGIPKIGCGLAGGDWEVVSSIIEGATPDLNITVVEYEK